MSEAPFGVVYLDNHLLVVEKPPGMLSQADLTGDADLVTLAKAFLKARFDKPGNVFVGLVHRLDRPVGGLVVLARTSKAAGRLSDQFRRRAVAKRYLAVCEGRLDGGGERVDWLRKGPTGTVERVSEGAPGAKRAVLRWRCEAVVERRTLVSVELLTGRAHQIRVQLAGLGAPIAGDLRYGAPAPFADGRGIALWSAALAVDHPTRGERLAFASAPGVWPGAFREATGRVVDRLRAELSGSASTGPARGGGRAGRRGA